MGTTVHLFLAVVAALLQVGPAFGGESLPVVEPSVIVRPALETAPQRLELVDMPPAFVDLAVRAVGLFEQASLELPPVRFVFHGDDDSTCGGYLGAHEQTLEHSVIGLCTTDPGPITEALILHELAHAWLEHDLDDDRRAEFQALRGYDRWDDHDVAWGERGCEQAAEIMVWGLIDRPIGFVTFDNHGCDALDAGYRTLTGTAPLHGYRDYC